MNYYVYIQKNLNKYPITMCQAHLFNLDASQEVDAEILEGGKRFEYWQTIRYCSPDTYNELLAREEMVIENEAYLQLSDAKKTPEIEIIGDTVLKSVKYNKVGEAKNLKNIRTILRIPDDTDVVCEYIVKDRIRRGKVLGYIPIGMNKFIRVKKRKKLRSYLIGTAVTLSLIALGLFVAMISMKPIMLIRTQMAFSQLF